MQKILEFTYPLWADRSKIQNDGLTKHIKAIEADAFYLSSNEHYITASSKCLQSHVSLMYQVPMSFEDGATRGARYEMVWNDKNHLKKSTFLSALNSPDHLNKLHQSTFILREQDRAHDKKVIHDRHEAYYFSDKAFQVTRDQFEIFDCFGLKEKIELIKENSGSVSGRGRRSWFGKLVDYFDETLSNQRAVLTKNDLLTRSVTHYYD